MSFEDYLKQIKAGNNLDRAGAADFLSPILDNTELPDASIAEALTALTKKTVTADEICGFIDAMRTRMVHLPFKGQAIDTCGTGGDGHHTFNISTAAAILLAAGGVKVAKHGNRAATSKCGSADVLEALGIPVDLEPTAAAKALEEHGFVFLFAPLYHPALKRLAIIRKQLGFPTVFNLLGPLLNPAAVKRQVIGTFSLPNAELLTEVAAQMNFEHAIILTSDDGLDEASLNAPVTIFEIKKSAIARSRLLAGDYGLGLSPLAAIRGGDAVKNAKIVTAALQPSAYLNTHQRIIALNAALGFYVSGQSPSIEDGVQKATETLTGGVAAAKLKELQAGK